MKKVAALVAIGLGIAALVFGIGGVWAWALFGMSEEIGTAFIYTFAMLAIAGFFMTLLAACMADEEKKE